MNIDDLRTDDGGIDARQINPGRSETLPAEQVDADACAEARRRATGQTATPIAGDYPVTKNQLIHHINGECSHENHDAEPPREWDWEAGIWVVPE